MDHPIIKTIRRKNILYDLLFRNGGTDKNLNYL